MADRVTWSIENAGSSISFSPNLPIDYVKLAGMSGTGVAPTTLQITSSVQGGGTWRRTSRGSRQVAMPIATYGNNREEVDKKLRALIRLLDDSYTSPRLVATYPNGQQFDAECHYSGGGDHTWGTGDTNGRTYCVWPIQLTCPSPYFTSRNVTQFTLGTSGAGRGLINGGPLTELRLSGSQALGTVTLTNPGDVESWPTWTVQGPGTLFTAVRAVDNASFQLSGTITTAAPVTVNTLAKTVTDTTGANRYGLLVGAPRLFSLPPANFRW